MSTTEYENLIADGQICEKCGDHFEDDKSPGYTRVCEMCDIDYEETEL